jgi:peptidoglycan hydrolase-like protein with peptidoglycan-binding domain
VKVQWALSRWGYYHGPIDGVIGPDGFRAIRAFQEAQGLPATGRIDPNVLRALKHRFHKSPYDRTKDGRLS